MRWTALAFLCLLIGCGDTAPAPEATPPAGPRYSAKEAATPDGVKLIVLRDDEAGIEASIAPEKGGEMSSFRVKVGEQWVETLYLANDYKPREGWTGKAPLLWPATGRNFPKGFKPETKPDGTIERGRYTLDGKTYEMPGHGFARDMPWTVDGFEATANHASAVLSLEDTEATRALYPFGYRLVATYELAAGALTIDYTVIAKPANDRSMPFSIGNHITFNTPLLPGGQAGAVEVTTPSTKELLKDAGLPTGETRDVSYANGLKLADYPVKEAVSLTGYDNDPYVVLRDPSGLSLRMSHSASKLPDQPYVAFNLWGDPPNGYFSPEPWVGLQNSFVLNRGLVSLDSGELFYWTIRLTPER
jgi:galactose mutarotase-like enzyme